jgi:hypothetical protein
MTKKITDTTATPYPEPPDHLSERSKALWRQIGPEKIIQPGQLPIFLASLESLDRSDTARALIDAEGMVLTTKSTGMTHLNPLLKTEAASRREFSRLWALLRLSDPWSPFGMK